MLGHRQQLVRCVGGVHSTTSQDQRRAGVQKELRGLPNAIRVSR